MYSMAIRSNFKVLRARLEAIVGRRISYKEISHKADIPEATLIRFANDKVDSVSYRTLENLSLYFSENGLGCEPGDLLIQAQNESAA